MEEVLGRVLGGRLARAHHAVYLDLRLEIIGGGVDTQSVLNRATPADVKEHVKRNLEIFAPGGGFVFNTVHNVMPDVPPENLVAMFEAVAEFSGD